MSDKQPDMDVFSGLMHELESPRNRPISPAPPAQFTADLRRHLLKNYDLQPLSRRGMVNLWRFAGMVGAFAIIIVAIVFGWLTLSSPPQTVSHPVVATLEEPVNETAVNPLLEDSIEINSVSPETNTTISGTTTFEVQLRYTLVSLPEAEIIITIFPVTQGPAILGNAIETIAQGEGEITMTFDFQPFDASQPSDWIMSINMYEPDSDAQSRKAIASASPNESLEDGWHYKLETAVSTDSIDRIWLISASPEPGTNLHVTGGKPIVFKLEIGYSLVSQPEAEIFTRLVARNGHVSPDRAPQIADIIFSQTIVQAGEGTVTFEILLSSEQSDNAISIIVPEIYMVSHHKDPFETLVYKKFDEAVWVFNTTTRGESAVQPATILNTNGLGLTIHNSPAGDQINILSEGDVVELMDSEPVTIEETTWLLVKTVSGLTGWVMDEYLSDSDMAKNDRLWLISAIQKEQGTAMVSFEVRLGMEINSAEMAVYKLHIAHPDWENNGLIVRDSLSFTPAYENTFRLTATPDQIRQATGTDNPVLVVEVWPQTTASQTLLTKNEPTISETFTDCPMDLTHSDKFTCTP